ncbi:hypothetical protein Lser_V15G22814 [Lactuca serriola]
MVILIALHSKSLNILESVSSQHIMEAFLKDFQYLEIGLEEIKSATNTFDKSKLIGEGGFGKVYEGVVTHSKGQSKVAFKRLDSTCGQGDPEFLKEILMLSRYTHENLISLLGFCNQDGERILVYEYACHGSLDRHVGSVALTWRQRLMICVNAATGLCYLHDPKETHERVIHRDIKSSNILLDESWNAKVSDMGLAKIGPANQKQTFLVSNVAGTLAYVDPIYMETSILTKESDVYSFGVVLLEVLCGTLCFEYSNSGTRKGLVRTWKKSYKLKDFEKIIFKDMKQQMDPRSLETYSSIAYQCLKKSREKRPEMYRVVEELNIALRFQENFEEVEPEMNYEEVRKSARFKKTKEMCKTAVPSLANRSDEELKILLAEGIFLNHGKTWFCLNKNGEHCEMISAQECFYPIILKPPVTGFYAKEKTRFEKYMNTKICSDFKIRVRTQYLSPQVTYAINLVFCLYDSDSTNSRLSYILAGETEPSSLYLADTRRDGWLTAELYQFTSDNRNVDLEITFKCWNELLVEGIEFQPVEIVSQQILEHQVLEDKREVDMQEDMSHLDAYWKEKLPSDYENIIKWSKDKLHWKTKKELYSILYKGFPIQIEGEEWFSLDKDGKQCLMIPATVALKRKKWSWRSLPESRFEEVAFDPTWSFTIRCTTSNMLLAQTCYGAYLVYKLQENHSGFERPLMVSMTSHFFDTLMISRYIYLISPQTPVIKRKAYENTHNPLNRPKIKGLPQQRKDGWIEVQIDEQLTQTPSSFVRLAVNIPLNQSLKGLIVQGIEFRPCN